MINAICSHPAANLNEMKRDSDAFREMYVKFREKYTLPESAYIARQAAEYR